MPRKSGIRALGRARNNRVPHAGFKINVPDGNLNNVGPQLRNLLPSISKRRANAMRRR
ncbi:MAG: hypothetical protein HY917_05075 [Candidatus Diapherotrites archaeon]|nr:hypothetical protein [Candidatus Diapherotrites archaeon]